MTNKSNVHHYTRLIEGLYYLKKGFLGCIILLLVLDAVFFRTLSFEKVLFTAGVVLAFNFAFNALIKHSIYKVKKQEKTLRLIQVLKTNQR